MLAKHSAIYFVGRIVPGIVSLSTLALLTRFMSPQEYGDYALVISGVGLINVVFFQWIGLALGRYYITYKDQQEVVMTVALVAHFSLMFFTGGIITVIFFATSDNHVRWLLGMVVVIGWAQAWFDINLRVAAARLNPSGYSMATAIKSLLGISTGIFLFWIGFGLKGFLAGIAISLLLTSLFFIGYWRSVRLSIFNYEILQKFIKYGAPMAIMYLLIIITDLSDRFFISWLLDTKAVGAYAPAYELAQQSLGMLISVVSLATLPLVINALEKNGQESAQRHIVESGRLLLQIAIPATLGLMILAEDIAMLLIGLKFRNDAIQIIPIIALATFFAGLRSGYFDLAFQLGFRLKGQLIVVAFSALMNVVLNLIFIPFFGVIGAAYATLIALFFALFLSAYLGKKSFPLPPLHIEKYRVILAASLMGVSLYIFRDWHGIIALLVKFVMAIFVYIISCIVLDINDSRLLASNMLLKFKKAYF